MPGKLLNSRCQEILLSVLDYFKKERDNNGPLVPYEAVQERVAGACKVSVTTVRRIVRREEAAVVTGEKLSTPRKTRKIKKSVRDTIDSFTKDAIRRNIYRMYSKSKDTDNIFIIQSILLSWDLGILAQLSGINCILTDPSTTYYYDLRKIDLPHYPFFPGEHITLNTLKLSLKQEDICDLSRYALHRLLPDIGFKYKKDDNRRLLCEKNYIAEQRISFLRKYRQNNLNVIFLDETWIFARGSIRKSWQNASSSSVKQKPTGEGRRYIVLSAGSKNGFVPNSALIFASKMNTGDYHGEMTADNFNKWLEEKLLPNLEEPSLIIMDNAPYHSQLVEKLPCISWNKSQLTEFLNKQNISFDNNLLKTELYAIAKNCKVEKRYVTDELIQSQGHFVLRLPPYHCQYNAIEQVWSQCKRYYDNHIGRDGFGEAKVHSMWQEALDQVTEEQWTNYVHHAESLIEESWELECQADVEEIAPFLIHVSSDSESEEEEDDSP